MIAARAARAALARARAAQRSGTIRTFDRDVLDALIELVPLHSVLSHELRARHVATPVYGVPQDKLTGWQHYNVRRSLGPPRHWRYRGRGGVGRAARDRVTFPKAESQDTGSKAKAVSESESSERSGAVRALYREDEIQVRCERCDALFCVLCQSTDLASEAAWELHLVARRTPPPGGGDGRIVKGGAFRRGGHDRNARRRLEVDLELIAGATTPVCRRCKRETKAYRAGTLAKMATGPERVVRV